MSRALSITLTSALVLTLGIASILGAYSIVNAATGGPDAYGYYFTDSTETGGPTYSWVEINGSGTDTGLEDDDYTAAIPLGFTFRYYGTNYTDIYIMSNGWISFTDQNTWYQFYDFPYDDSYIAPISALSTDLNPESGGAIYYQTLGSAPNRTFVVEWDGVPLYPAAGSHTFEIILYEGSNDILFQYNSITYGGNVGIEDETQTMGLDYSPSLPSDGLAILFYLLNTPPDIPTLNSPGDGATDIVLTPDLVFDYSDPDSDACTDFNIRVDDDPMFCSLDVNDSVSGSWPDGSSITYAVTTPLAPGTQYYWMVSVFDGADWSVWSDGSWDFTTGFQGGGADKNTYRTTENVYVDATGFPPNSDVDVYVVRDYAWNDTDSIPPVPAPVFAFDTFTTDGAGNIVNELIWHSPLEIGEYDVVFDAGQDGIYNEIPDLVDDPNHPGFTVFSSKVGGEVYPVDKAALLAPWLISGAVLVLAAGGLILIRRRAS